MKSAGGNFAFGAALCYKQPALGWFAHVKDADYLDFYWLPLVIMYLLFIALVFALLLVGYSCLPDVRWDRLMEADYYFDINLLFDERWPSCNNHGYPTNQQSDARCVPIHGHLPDEQRRGRRPRKYSKTYVRIGSVLWRPAP